MFPKALFVLTAVALAVNAQSSPTPSASSVPLSPCALQCLTPAAAQNGCASITDTSCVCTNLQFQSDAGACLQEHCPAADVQAALALQQQFCAGITPSSTVFPTPRPVSFTSVSAISTPPVSPSVSPSKSSALPTSPKPSSTASAASSPSASAATGTSLQTGAGAFFGAILAAVFAL